MTWRTLRRWIWVAIAVYALLAVAGCVLRYQYLSKDGKPEADGISIGAPRPEPPKTPNPYETYKDLVPLLIALPAAWLAFCFQKRASYVQQLRALWTKLIDAVEDAITYTYKVGPNQEEFGKVSHKLHSVIDEVRGVFRNLHEKRGKGRPVGRSRRSGRERGLYPFEGVKEIRDYLFALGFGPSFSPYQAALAREKMIELWHHVRDKMLTEFDRSYPTYADSLYRAPESGWPTTEPSPAPAPASSRGKWVVLVPLLELDYWWGRIERATAQGSLTTVARINLAPPRSRGQRAIWAYADPANRPEVDRVRAALRALGVTWAIRFESGPSNIREAPPSPLPLNDVRQLAFQKWEAAGRPEGDGKPFWTAAEQQLRQDP
jgi:hypothetical protein